jgi:hypothetical protein
MGQDIIFNLEDMDIKEENLDFISETPAQEGAPVTTEEAVETPQGTLLDAEGNEQQQSDAADAASAEEREEQDASGEQASQEDTPSSDDSSQNSTLNALAQYLREEGVLFVEEELKDINSLEDLKELIKNSNEKAGYANLNETQRRYQEALKSGIPKSEFEKIENEIQTYANIKEEDVVNNPQLRYEILAIDMINQGVEKEKAMRLAKLSLNDENNVTDAKKALQDILESKKTKFQTLAEEAKKGKELSVNDVKKSVFEKEKLFDTKLNDITKNKLFDMITTEVDRDEEGRGLNELQKWQKDNPVESSIMLNYLFMMTNKGKDLSLIRKSGESKASKDLEQRLRSTLQFDENGSLIIPDSMVGKGGSGNNQKQNNNNKLSINI